MFQINNKVNMFHAVHIHFTLTRCRIDIFFSILGNLHPDFSVDIWQRIQVIFMNWKFSGNQKLCINWNFIRAELF